jgi:hypothetical protein
MWSARNKMRNNDNRASREFLSASGLTIRTVWDVLRWGRSGIFNCKFSARLLSNFQIADNPPRILQINQTSTGLNI